MKILIEIIGMTLVLVGLIFTAQSKELLGPANSFMYSNPSWTTNGFMIIIAGIIILILGLILRIIFRYKLKHKK
jgi:uncharacterized membrane protein